MKKLLLLYFFTLLYIGVNAQTPYNAKVIYFAGNAGTDIKDTTTFCSGTPCPVGSVIIGNGVVMYVKKTVGWKPIGSSGTEVSGSFTSPRIPFANGTHSLIDNKSLKFDSTHHALTFSSNSAKIFNVGSESIYAGINTGNFTENTSSSHGNVGIGINVLPVNTLGHQTVGVGVYALESNSIGNAQTAVGAYVLNHSNADNNNGFGNHALFSNTLGADNNGFGRDALFSNTIGINNTGTGSFVLRANTTGISNSGYGYGVLNANVNGSGNTGSGVNCFLSLNGDFNTGYGFNCGANLSGGTRNLFLGSYSGYNETNISNALLINNSSDSTTLPYLVRGFFDKGTITFSSHKKNQATVGIGYISGYAPLFIESGALLGAVKNNTIENDGTHLYYSSGGSRYQLDRQGTIGGTAIANAISVGSGTNTVTSYINNLTFLDSSDQLTIGGANTGTATVTSPVILSMKSGSSTNSNGSNLNVYGGDGAISSGNGNGGNVVIKGGNLGGSGHNGYIILQNVPTSAAGLPSGAIWSNAGILTIVP